MMIEGISEAVLLAIIAAASGALVLIGSGIQQWLTHRREVMAQRAANTAAESGTEEGLRREMAIRLVAQDTRIDLLMQSVQSWQDKFYAVQLEQGILRADNVCLSERVSELEKVRDSLTIRISEAEKDKEVLIKRIASLEAERLTLLNRITVLEAALAALRGGGVNGKVVEGVKGA